MSYESKGLSLYQSNKNYSKLCNREFGDITLLERARAREIGITYLINQDKVNARKLIKGSKRDFGEDGVDRIFEMFKKFIEKEWY